MQNLQRHIDVPVHEVFRDHRVETSLVCMIVSNPAGGEQPEGWKKRVNDHIRTLQKQVVDILRMHRSLDAETVTTMNKLVQANHGLQTSLALMEIGGRELRKINEALQAENERLTARVKELEKRFN